mmetsp:Transcript_26917/g.61747  ORF Transcript_26917/g.61747 Transcript_26917/m.61747 type:complete len:81 (-) Transcript_26917:469-711(-)
MVSFHRYLGLRWWLEVSFSSSLSCAQLYLTSSILLSLLQVLHEEKDEVAVWLLLLVLAVKGKIVMLALLKLAVEEMAVEK